MIIVSRDEIPKENLAKPPAWNDRISKWLIGTARGSKFKTNSKPASGLLYLSFLIFSAESDKPGSVVDGFCQSSPAQQRKADSSVQGPRTIGGMAWLIVAFGPYGFVPVTASHGHSAKIADQADDNEIATAWF